MRNHIKYVLIIFILFFKLQASSQELTAEQRVTLADAQYLFINEEYKKALVQFKSLADEVPDNANFNYLTGYCFLKSPFENGRSIPYLKKAITKLSLTYKEGSKKETNAPIDALFWLGYAYHLNKNFVLAQRYYKRYRDTLDVEDIPNRIMVDRQIESCDNAFLLTKNPVGVEIENLGNMVNSAQGDFNPCVNGNGKQLIYTRIKPRKDTSNLNVYSKRDYQILETFQNISGRWSKPVDITQQFGNVGELKTLSLSSNGDELLLFRDDLEQGGPLGYKNGGIYYSKKENGKWTTARLLNSNINSVWWESHAAISPNGKEIYFTSDRPGGYGGLDIYVSTLKNGDWGEAQNLGSVINTNVDEETPEILPDGKTLYFSSEGHNNMGGFDVFHSTKVDSLHWFEPVNMGYPINSTDDNLFYVPIEDGSKAFYSVARNEGYFTFGEEDIYELEIILDSLHMPKITLKGKITTRNNAALDSSVTVICRSLNPKKKTEIVKVKPDLNTGVYELELKPEEYELSFVSTNYNKEIRSVSFKKIKSLTPVTLDIILDPIYYDENKSITFNKVYFNFINSTLTDEAKSSLDKLYVVMLNNPDLVIEVTGYTDSKGVDKQSKELASARANSVINYLIGKGISKERFVAKAEAANLKTWENFSRCAEIKILKSEDLSVVITDIKAINTVKKYNRYSIQLLESPTTVSMSRFYDLKKDFPNILGFAHPSGYIYYVGNYKNQGEAAVLLNIIKTNGFADARVIDYFYIHNLNNFEVSTVMKSFTKFSIFMESSKTPIPELTNKKDIKMKKSKDGTIRYYFKMFTSLDEAEKELKILNDGGYPKAFIVDVRDMK